MPTKWIYMVPERVVPNSIPPGSERTPVYLQGTSLQCTAALSMNDPVHTPIHFPAHPSPPEEIGTETVYEDVHADLYDHIYGEEV